jgi:Na+-driven multidrug efflux pump
MFEAAFVLLVLAFLLAMFGLYLFFPDRALRMMGRDPTEPEVWPYTKWWARTVGLCGLVFTIAFGVASLIRAMLRWRG